MMPFRGIIMWSPASVLPAACLTRPRPAACPPPPRQRGAGCRAWSRPARRPARTSRRRRSRGSAPAGPAGSTASATNSAMWSRRRHRLLQEDAVQPRLRGKADVALLLQLPLQGALHGLADLDAAAGQLPARHVGVEDQEHPAVPVEHQAAHAQRHATLEPPIGVEYPAQDTVPQRRHAVLPRPAAPQCRRTVRRRPSDI